MINLDEIRNNIDKIDDEIVKLFIERMGLSYQVAESKRQSGKAVYDSTREDKILFRLASQVPENMKFYIKDLYSTIFAISKSYQSRLLNSTSNTVEILNSLTKETVDFPVSATVACQGVLGANSAVAAKRVFSVCDISYFKTFEGVFTAVDKQLCEFGVLPIENSTAGSVLEVYDLMKKYSFSIVRSIRVKINHCLAVLPGVEKKDIKKIISHNQALKQCSEYVKTLNVEAEDVENTAVAAKRLLESQDASLGVLCSKECAEIYGLKIIEEGVQDSLSNYTRFIVISKNLKIYEGSNKISVMITASNESGSLSKILSRFSALGLNLTKIENRPIVGSDFEVLFYLDFEGSIKDIGVLSLIAELENSSMHFVFLGGYKEIL